MRIPVTKSLYRKPSLRIVMMSTLFIMCVAPSLTAQAQGRNGGLTTGPSTTQGSAGATGTPSSRGGAGGVANPAPGGEPSSLGSATFSPGPRATETSRTGYVGARTNDTVTPPPVEKTLTLSIMQFGRCPPRGLQPHPATRMTGSNLGRIQTIARHLRQGQSNETGDESTARYLLADMQQELEQNAPDPALVGTYLGLISDTPVTPALVTAVSGSLCRPISASAAEDIAAIAEEQRNRMMLGR